MKGVSTHLRALIKRDGGVSVADFFRLAVRELPESYYQDQQPFGVYGDFITAPEISQVFGECVGAWCLDLWLKLGSPEKFHLVELGPGRGTLMSDILRVGKLRKGFCEGADVRLVEASSSLRQAQSATLSDATYRSLEWDLKLDDIPLNGPLILVANEFFDALPARQFIKTRGGWFERNVTFNDAQELVFGCESAPVLDYDIPEVLATAPVGSIFERSDEARDVAHHIAYLLSRHSGGALIIDYGYEGPKTGDTLQALKKHQYANALEMVGECDLTFHVDFGLLRAVLTQPNVWVGALVSQSRFLSVMGAVERTQQLAKRAPPQDAERLLRTLDRLMSPQQMGSLFKVLCATSPRDLQPAGVW